MIVIGHDPRTGRAITAADEDHVVVWGPPRSGKTSRVLVPSVQAHPGPAVVASSKDDVLAATAAIRSQRGPVWVMSLEQEVVRRSRLTPAGWSPVAGCDDWDEALLRAHAMVGATTRGDLRFWYGQAERLPAALLHASALHSWGVEDLARWALVGDLDEPAKLLAEHDAYWQAGLVAGIADADSKLRDSVVATTGHVLRVYDSELARSQAELPPFAPADFFDRNGTLYVVAPAELQALLAPIVVGMLDEVRRAAYRRRGGLPVLFALDELANIAPLPELPALLSEGGSQGVQVLACLQDASQARYRWGTLAEAFPTMFRHKILLPGLIDHDLLGKFSAVLGEERLPAASGPLVSPSWPIHELATPPVGHAVHIDRARAAHVALADPRRSYA